MELMIGDENIYLRKRSYRRYYVIVGVLAALAGFLVGILLGRFAIPRTEDKPAEDPVHLADGAGQQHTIPDSPPVIPTNFEERISADNIRRYLKNITARPHLAGTAGSEDLARQLALFWRELGLDEVKLTPYDIPIPRPNLADPNTVQVLDNDGNVVFTSSPVEKTLIPEDNIDLAVPPIHGFSPAGDVTADVVYVNYGRLEDFRGLTEDMGINITGRIVLARYGKVFRGDIVNIAEKFGAAGVILYSDPIDYTWGEEVYPNDWWLPGLAVQRGVVSLSNGDPLTPGYPSIGSAYRLPENHSSPSLPTIPSQPIGYTDAQFLLRQLNGHIAPDNWHGGLNLTYRLGGLRQGRVRLHVANQVSRHTVYNVIGIIRGSIEPDRYVIIGNHRDAWGYGAFDPGCGSAVIKELSRVYASMVKQGRRPRRSLVFCSWGAEEIGLVGSTEWVEQFAKVLNDRAVAYINIDTAIQGNYTLEGNASPLLYHAMYEATKMVANPDASERQKGLKTVYDKWLHVFPWRVNENEPYRPKLKQLGAASDYATFYQRLGIPAIDVHYVYNKVRIKNIAYHPLYHTAYDTFYSFQSFADPDFQISKTMAHVFAETSMLLADSVILPFNVSDYALAITKFTHDILTKYGDVLETVGGLSLDELRFAEQRFAEEAKEFLIRVENVNKSSPILVRMVNDQLMKLERAFMDPAGLPGRPLSRHVVFAPSAVDSYAGASFPGLTDALFALRSFPDDVDQWEVIKKQWSVVVYTVLSAASTLRDVTNFMSDYFI